MQSVGLVGASLEGFRVIRREPLAVLVWCGLAGLLIIWPLMFFFIQIFPAFSAMDKVFENQTDPTAFPPEFMQLFVRMQLLNLWSIVGRLAWFAIFNAAVMRVVLRSDDRGRFYLKLGMDEVWQAVLGVIFYIGYLIVLMVAALIAVTLGFTVAAASVPSGIAVGALVGIAGLGAVLWLFLRMSMAFPLTFIDRELRLFESWKLTRGHAGGLFGMAVCAVVFAFLIEMVFLTVAFAITIPMVIGLHLPTGSEVDPFAAMADIWPRFWPLLTGAAILFPPLVTLMTLVTSAPWAEACRLITPHGETEQS